ncbi:protein kinase [Nocardia yunnanensis]|uniref:mitogen-activated protein kinase kinase n=1 Tax=Nocardia yunnanensis TaxID=2382165 RepID=A0A386ZKN0_9NOCA|nr:serine/threonine-protein kinase [Nocardia yunnanensis]AYF77189.1 protein kinase [Nocardia yunnanensis]
MNPQARPGGSRSEPNPPENSTQAYLPIAITDELEAMGLVEAEEIGRGGFGVVYRCTQRALDRVVAVKVLSTEIDDDGLERFLREEHAMGRLSGHPNIVDILQVDVTPSGLPYIVMPYATRGSLEQVVRDNGPLSWSDSLRVGVKLSGAIETAHRAQVLHRDVKPANVLLSRYGEPQLTDFGIARIPGGFRTSTRLITGSPAFTAPEVLKGDEPTVRSDVYGLGSTLFALLTGHAAFERQAGEKVIAQFLRITSQPVPDLRELQIPSDVAAAIEAAMSPDPDDRPASAVEFGDLLRTAQIDNGQVPDEMALLDGDSQPAEGSDSTATQALTHRRAKTVVTAPRSPSLTLRPAGGTSIRFPATGNTLPPTPATKFRPPNPVREPIPRPRLLEPLRAGGRRRLALIHGPAGFGKSTLAAQWRAELTDRGVAVAWIGIDRDDDNEVWLLAHIIAAIRKVRPEIGAGLEQLLEERPAEAVPYAVSALADELAASDQPVVVVVDDWHRIGDAGAQRVMESLLDNCSHHLRFVITGRERAGLPLSRLQVADELVEIGGEQLRLTVAETRELLVERMGLELSERQVEQIHTATDGWPAAIQLVGLSLRPADHDVDRLIAGLSGDNKAIREYLAENVLDTLEPRMLEFLTAVAVPERVNASLAEALTGARDAADLLDQAEQRELFLHRVADDPSWYRMQPMVAEHLRARLDRAQPGQLKKLHGKASRWFAAHNLIRQSVDHALAATELNYALDLVEKGGMDLIDSSRLATLFGTVSKLPVQQVASRSKLLMALARANVNLQQSGAARTALGRLSNMLSRSSPGDVEAIHQRCQAAVLAAADQVARDRTDGVLDKLAESLELADELPPWTVSTAANLASYVRLCEFDFEGARAVQKWAAPYHARSADPLGEVFGLCAQGDIAYEQLDIEAATGFFEQAWQTARDRAGSRSNSVRVAAALLGEVAYRRGDLDSAERLLDQSHELTARVGPVDFLVTIFVSGARVKAVRGDLETAAARLDEGARIAAERKLTRLAAHVRAERLRLGLPADASTAGLVTDPMVRSLRHATGAAALAAEAEEFATVRALLARHYRGEDRATDDLAPLGTDDTAVKRARALHARIREQRRPRAELDSGLLLAECLSVSGWLGESIAVLTPVVIRCAELGWRRPLLDAGPGVSNILRTLRHEMPLDTGGPDGQLLPRQFLDSLI